MKAFRWVGRAVVLAAILTPDLVHRVTYGALAFL